MIKIHKNDNTFDIINKIESRDKKNKKIILKFPFGHYILYNKIALKSIKDFFSDNTIVITTTDILSKKIWKQIWIKYNLIKNADFIENKDILKYNYSFFEYFIYEIKKILNSLLNFLLKKKNHIDPRKKFLKYYKQKSNLLVFISILLITISIFSYVFLFALNKTYVKISPDVQVKTRVQNFTFKENIVGNNLNTNIIKLEEINKTISLSNKIFTTWVAQKEKYRASWKVIFINKYNTEVKLRNKTRLLSKDWIIYETKNWITIPAATLNKAWTIIPWKFETKVIASLRDVNWQIIWKRWNTKVENILLILPWLEAEDKENIYAKIDWKMTWWKDNFENILSESDLKNAKKIFREKLKKEAITKIQNHVKDINKINNSQYQILHIDDIYKFSNLDIKTPNLKKWDKIKYFIISWNIEIKTYIFNLHSIISRMRRWIENNILKGREKLLYIDNKININSKKWILYRRNNPFELRATVEIEYNIAFNFLNKNDNYIRRLKQSISWLTKWEAEKKLINENSISNAEITIRPFFIENVSKNFNSIEFNIKN